MVFWPPCCEFPHLVVAVNKMDLVDYDQAIYEKIVKDYTDFSRKLNVQGVTYIPISALRGDNVVDKGDNMPWYDGPTLLHHLENVNVGASLNNVDFRYPVQYVIRPNQNFRGYAGQIASGRIAQGEEVVVLPSGLSSRVESIVSAESELEEAIVGDSVVLTLEDEIDISRGDMIVRKRNLPQKSNRVDATICWMNEEPLNPRATYWVQHTTRLVKGFISELNYKIDVDTMHRETADTLTLNEIGRVQLTTTQPLFYDRYQINRTTGSFILIDPATNNTVAAGMIRGKSRNVGRFAGRRGGCCLRPAQIEQCGLGAGRHQPGRSGRCAADIKRRFCGLRVCLARVNRRLPRSWSSAFLPTGCTRCFWTATICGMA